MSGFKSEESAFNFAVEYLKSIKNSLDLCKNMSFRQDIDGWLKAIRMVYREVSLLTNEAEDKEIEKEFIEIYKLINDEESRFSKKSSILFKLDKLEIKLRKKIQQKGMALPNKADPRFAILER